MNRLFWFILMTAILVSCINDKRLMTFDSKYSDLIDVFKTKDIAVFNYAGKYDTIIFHTAESNMKKVRHLERGFYNEYVVNINYELTSGSFHRFTANQEMNNIRFFLTLTNNSGYDKTVIGLHFLGLIFDEDGVDKQISNDTMIMKKEFAVHSGININESVTEFKFLKKKGIIEFKDINGNIWKRKK